MAGSILNVKPNGNIANSGFGTPNPADLGDGSDSTYYSATIHATSYFIVTCSGGSIPSNSKIISITPKIRASRSGGSETIQFNTGLMVLGSPFVAPANSVIFTSTTTNFTGAAVTVRPDTSAAWTPPDLGSLILKGNGPGSADIGTFYFEGSLDINYVHPTVPTITGPTGSTKNLSPTLTATVTDAETGKTQNVLFQVATDAAFTNILESGYGSAAQTGALSASTFTRTMITTLPDAHGGVKYYLRARTEDTTYGTIGDWCATTIFYVNQATAISGITGMPGDGATGVARTTRTFGATGTDPDGDNWTLQFQLSTNAADPSSGSLINLTTYPTLTASGSSTSLAVALAGLLPSTTYYWWGYAQDNYSPATDHTKYSQIYSFTTSGPPAAPVVAAIPTQLGGGTVTPTWTAQGDGQSAYAIRRKLDSGGTYQYWTGSSWTGTETQISGSVMSAALTGFTTQTLFWYVSVKTWDLESTASTYATDVSFLAHDAPTVTVTAPTGNQIIATAGPMLSVSWNYSQAQSVPQAKYRVIIKNAAGSTTYYDSGLLPGTQTTLLFDAIAGGVPSDTTAQALKVTVYVESSDGAATGTTSGAIAFDIQWGVVTLTVSSPVGVVTAASATANWTFSSTRGQAQGWYRVRLFSPSGPQYSDSGWVAGTATSFVIPVQLQDNSVYLCGIQVRNAMGVYS